MPRATRMQTNRSQCNVHNTALRLRGGAVENLFAVVLFALIGSSPSARAGEGPWRPPATAERAEERGRMVDTQIAFPPEGRPAVTDANVLDAMRTVPRHLFVPQSIRARAYEDGPLPIGEDQTISQPYIVAFMTELLKIDSESRVLEIGTGSGYQAAVLAHITPHVFSIEIVEPLAERARKTLAATGYEYVHLRTGDGYLGWEEHAPFDAIIVTAAAGHVPPPLWEQLKPGGRIVMPIGDPYTVQRLAVIEKDAEGRRSSNTAMMVRFVPMTGLAREIEEAE
jgi:protein-L-isoaspartate(D-aspartate) O-methyltransferase